MNPFQLFVRSLTVIVGLRLLYFQDIECNVEARCQKAPEGRRLPLRYHYSRHQGEKTESFAVVHMCVECDTRSII